MCSFLRFTRVRCPIRKIFDIKRFYWTNHGFALPEELGIRYFIPRTSDPFPEVQVEGVQAKHGLPPEFRVIYKFQNERILRISTYCVLGLLLSVIYNIFQLKKPLEIKSQDENQTEDKEELSLDSACTKKEKVTEEGLPIIQAAFESDAKLKLGVAFGMIMFFLFFIRTKIVLTIYRNSNEFVTVFYKPLGFGEKLVHHKAEDCEYHPRRYLNFKLFGKYIIAFSEFFINREEQLLYVGASKLKEVKPFRM